MTGLDCSRIRYRVLAEARANIGYGDRGNNTGPFIKAMGGTPGEDWCALFAGWCYRKAYADLNLPTPSFTLRRPGHWETGAKALTKALGRVGCIFEPGGAVQPLPGDLVAWSRGMLPWQGHVGIVTQGGQYIAGNEGKSGRVHERPIEYCKLKLWRFASVEDYYG